MSRFYLALALFLLLTVAAGLVRVVRGPAPADRMLAAQLFGSTGVATLLLLAEGLDQPAFQNVAIVFALLAAMATIVFVRSQAARTDPGAEGQ